MITNSTSKSLTAFRTTQTQDMQLLTASHSTTIQQQFVMFFLRMLEDLPHLPPPVNPPALTSKSVAGATGLRTQVSTVRRTLSGTEQQEKIKMESMVLSKIGMNLHQVDFLFDGKI